jgi:hypothetical protein
VAPLLLLRPAAVAPAPTTFVVGAGRAVVALAGKDAGPRSCCCAWCCAQPPVCRRQGLPVRVLMAKVGRRRGGGGGGESVLSACFARSTAHWCQQQEKDSRLLACSALLSPRSADR